MHLSPFSFPSHKDFIMLWTWRPYCSGIIAIFSPTCFCSNFSKGFHYSAKSMIFFRLSRNCIKLCKKNYAPGGQKFCQFNPLTSQKSTPPPSPFENCATVSTQQNSVIKVKVWTFFHSPSLINKHHIIQIAQYWLCIYDLLC